ncbi:MAG: hypothetical protein WCW27_03020 [Patescibacteria group bacterium]|jgi:hypothetical protein
MRKQLQALVNNELGMSLSVKIMVGFAGAVVAVFLLGVIVYFVKS